MPMIITDPRLPDNPIVFVNDAFGKLTGYPIALDTVRTHHLGCLADPYLLSV